MSITPTTDLAARFEAKREECEGAPYGIVDPDYARVFTIARCIAWSEGYAMLMHGSFTRDLDLLAVPWAERAADAEHLIRRIAFALDELDILIKDEKGTTATQKPHGRRSWTLTFKAFGDPRFIDIGVMPTAEARGMARAVAAGGAGARELAQMLKEGLERAGHVQFSRGADYGHISEDGVAYIAKFLTERVPAQQGSSSPLSQGGWLPMKDAPTGVPIIAKHKPNARMPLGWVGTITLGHGDEEEPGTLDTILHYNGDILIRKFHGCWEGWLPFGSDIRGSSSPPLTAERVDLGELERLSAEATQGAWTAAKLSPEGHRRIAAAGVYPTCGREENVPWTGLASFIVEVDGCDHPCGHANIDFVVTLVNAYRSGRLIEAPAPENWKPVPDWGEFYEVSDHGRVKSLARRMIDKKGLPWLREASILNTSVTVRGYPTVSLQAPGRPRWCVTVHRLVASAFIPNPDGLPFVNHKDSDRTNNSVSNLEWCTHQENVAHAKAAGRLTGRPRGHISEKRGFTDDEIRQVRALKLKGISEREIADKFGVGPTDINYIVKGKTYVNVV